MLIFKITGMKKIISIFLIASFFFCFIPVQAGNNMQNSSKSEIQNNKHHGKGLKKKRSDKKKNKDANSEKQARELKKKEIEAKERSIDRNIKVKKVSVDDNLPETVHQRNIP